MRSQKQTFGFFYLNQWLDLLSLYTFPSSLNGGFSSHVNPFLTL